MKLSRTVTAALALALLGSGCARLEAARRELAKDEVVAKPKRQAVVVTFDGSGSFRPYIERSLAESKRIFQRLAVEQPDADVTVLMIDRTTKNLYSGPASKLQTAYDALAEKIRRGGSDWSNISDAFTRADFFLRRRGADVRTHIVFSDMEHSLPGYRFNEADPAPVPKGFPWRTLRGVQTHLAFVSYEEWRVWNRAARVAKVSGGLRALLPEDLTARHVADIAIPKPTTEEF